MKGETRGEDLYNQVSAVIERMKLSWRKLANVTTHGSPNLTGKRLGCYKDCRNNLKSKILIRMSFSFTVSFIEKFFVSLHCS